MDKNKIEAWKLKRKNRKLNLNDELLFQGIRSQDYGVLSSAITLLESTLKSDQLAARSLIAKCLPFSGNSIRVGITGVPGVGKSTFIESFGMYALNQGKKVAVLAVDPSSEKSGGSILGDKTRMTELSQMKNVFIRPSAAGKSLGGVARKTREAIFLCEAAGFDYLLIETVGVGQSETAVHSMVDFFLLLMLAGAGDELQGIKRGIMEMADALVITKADGDNLTPAQRAKVQYQNAMHLFPANENGWIPSAFVTSALDNLNIDKVFNTIESFSNQMVINGFKDKKRINQDIYWLKETILDSLYNDFHDTQGIKEKITNAEHEIIKRKITSFQAADELIEFYKKQNHEI